MPINVAVIGAGSWGTTVAALAAVNTPTILWSRRPELAAQINDAHVNGDYLPSFVLPEQLRATSSLEEAVSHADVLVMAVPSHGYRDVASEAAQFLRPWVPVVTLSKGHSRMELRAGCQPGELPLPCACSTSGRNVIRGLRFDPMSRHQAQPPFIQ
jgi:glycerol-3-phosphate dehydrogenase (NAD(P)+)